MNGVRWSRPGDEPALRALWKTVFGDEDKFLDLFFREVYAPGSAAVAETDGVIVASAYVIPFGSRRYIYAVGTHPEHRGQGHGRAVTLFAADGKASYLSPADPALRDWYISAMGAVPVSRRWELIAPKYLRPIPAEEYVRRRETLLADTPHAEYPPAVLRLFEQYGGFYEYTADGGGVCAVENSGAVAELLPPLPGGEVYVLGLNGAESLHWGLTLA